MNACRGSIPLLLLNSVNTKNVQSMLEIMSITNYTNQHDQKATIEVYPVANDRYSVAVSNSIGEIVQFGLAYDTPERAQEIGEYIADRYTRLR